MHQISKNEKNSKIFKCNDSSEFLSYGAPRVLIFLGNVHTFRLGTNKIHISLLSLKKNIKHLSEKRKKK